jgi:hypothetical protein
VVRWSRYCVFEAIAIVVAVALPAGAQWAGDNHGSPVYQRHAFERPPHDYARGHGQPPQHGHGQPPQYAAPPVASGWFQRPYPYHLDYYRMRYGGSYAPYFGNLYGPPAVYAPYYGSSYGGYGYPYGASYAPNGYPSGSGPMESPLPPPVESDSRTDVPAP